MLPRHHPGRIRIAFDDRRLVANAGLILPATLALHLGLPQLVDRHLDLGDAPGRANPGDKISTLVASAPRFRGGQQRGIAPRTGVAPVSSTGQAVAVGSLLGQSVGLADRRIKVDGEWCVAGPGPSGPGPGQQLAAHPVQLADLAPPEAAQEGAQSLPSRKRGVDGALTVLPRVQAIPPVRNTSASSMQSPPARPCPRESGGQPQPGSSSCRPCSPGPGRGQGRDGCGPVRAGPGAGPGWPAGPARHWPPGGDRRRRCGCSQAC